ncbi:hypothetical protein Dsin_018788 [Dipteronia sinensis]|uniref:HAT C-terminal dimerisation domain-containing protein n=1 Tax=Dipteronia sinensis TaxID=43782 RepID=A0AAE0A6I6_9ROSI|nr:hypothetical protein Dsin_018788 [Dipteronia sinensis]
MSWPPDLDGTIFGIHPYQGQQGVTSPDSIEAANIIDVYNEEKEKLSQYLKKLSSGVCLTVAENILGYTCLTVCFIDDDWKLKNKLIAFKRIKQDQNAVKFLKSELLEWRIDNNISSMVKRDYNDRCSLRDRVSKICNYITETPSKNETFRIAIDRAKSFRKEVIDVVIPTTLELKNMFEVWCDHDNDSILIFKISLIGEKTEKWFLLDEDECFKFTEAMDNLWCESNLVLAVAAVLDPRFEMDIVKHWYRKIYGDEWESQLTIFMNYFTGVYNEYAKGTNNFKSCNSGSEETNSSITYEMLDPSGKPSKSSRDPNHDRPLNSELHLYLKEVKFPLIKDFYILKWWQGNIQYFPTLAIMTRDFLSIQISTTPFKYSGIPGFYKYIDSDMVKEAFLCTRDWLNSEEYLF